MYRAKHEFFFILDKGKLAKSKSRIILCKKNYKSNCKTIFKN